MEGVGRSLINRWNYMDGRACLIDSSSTIQRPSSRLWLRKSRGSGRFGSSTEHHFMLSYTSPFLYTGENSVYFCSTFPLRSSPYFSGISTSATHSCLSKVTVSGAFDIGMEFRSESAANFFLISRSPEPRPSRTCANAAIRVARSAGPVCSSFLGHLSEIREDFPRLRLCSYHIRNSIQNSKAILRSSNQFNTSNDNFSKSSSRRSPDPTSYAWTRNSVEKSDSEYVRNSQASGKCSTSSGSNRSGVRERSSSVSADDVPSTSSSEFSEDTPKPLYSGYSRQSSKSPNSDLDVSRSSKLPSGSLGGLSKATNAHSRNPPETAQTPARGTPYFKASSESYKAQIVQAQKIKAQQGTKSSLLSSNTMGTSLSSSGKVKSSTVQSTTSEAIKIIGTSPGVLNRYSQNSLVSDSSQPDFNGGTSHSPVNVKQSAGRVAIGRSQTDADFSPSTETSCGISVPDSFPESINSLMNSDPAVTFVSIPRKYSPQQSIVRKESGQVVTGINSLDRLHQQLEDQAKGNGSRAIIQKPLGTEEAIRLRDRLKMQKKKGMQAIHQRLFQSRQSTNAAEEEEFSCSVDPDTLILGEFVVHKRVGVGKYIGVKHEVPPGKERLVKYIYLKYADGIAKLKARQAQRLLYRYHLPGETGRAPTLSKLKDPSLWEKRKSKGKIAIQKLVVNMMELYIHRLKQSRPPYPKNPTAVTGFAANFPYVPTPDQKQAFLDVERDMTQRDLPMDRLICGDVGFGKTEVALRAILIAVAAGKQVMVLAPSTVLAKQHYETIRDRFSGFLSVKVALMCRFQKESEKKDLIVGIHDGSLSVVVGTHSLLGNQIRYHNLGLLIIDEEQRFGVKQKEKITCLKTSVDVLTLSATPIPRTLYLAMSGFRDASLLTTPPPERRPIQTHLMEYDGGVARTAIQFELDRGGQVFYVVPRVKGIEDLQSTLQSQFPDIKVAIAHGKQAAAALEEAMENFCEGETKILLCTNIIESGLDIRMVNTIIVEDVHLFGLAQLYQLRGRVGRAHREAHAYLFHPHKSLLTDEAVERLVALEDCCELGQGFQLAERDMAIRGIGSLFGEQQSGDAAKIGIDLYFEMLLEGLSKVDSQRLPQVEYGDVQLELGIDAHVPSDYIQSPEEREEVVKNGQRAAKESLRALMVFTNRLRENYGKEPASMEMLLKTMYVRRMAADLGIHRLRTHGLSIIMETNMSLEAFEMIASSITSESVRLSLTFESGYIEMQGLIGLPQERQLERIFCCLVDMVNSLPSFVKYI